MPWERHDHFDPDGNLTGYTIVTRESRWPDEQRTRMLALAEYEAGVHEICGLHDSIASEDPTVALEDTVCPLCADIELKLRVRAHEEHEAESEDPAEQRPSDGRRSTLRVLSPAEKARIAVDGRDQR